MKNTKNDELKTPQLKTILNKVGKTPIDEPEIYTLIKDDDKEGMAFYEVPLFVINRADKEIEDFDSDELALLYRLVSKKVTGAKYDSGEYKSTEATKNLENLSYKNRVTLFSITKKGAKLISDGSPDKDDIDDSVKEQKTFIWGVVNLDKNDLTDWEQGLVESICIDQALDVASTALDVELGN